MTQLGILAPRYLNCGTSAAATKELTGLVTRPLGFLIGGGASALGIMNFGQSLHTCLISKVFNVHDRAPRSEFWWFMLALTIFNIIGGLVMLIPILGAIVYFVVSIWLFIAQITATVRRLHDVNKRGWWILLPMASMLVVMVVLVMAIVATDPYFATSEYPIAASGQMDGILIGAALVSFIISIVILVFLIKKGTVGPNRFGPDPLQQGYFNPSFAPQGFNPQYGYGPQGFDPSQVPQGYNPQNYQGYGPQGDPQGYGPQGGPQGYNPQYGPQGYGPQGFDPNQAPNGAWPQQGQWQQPQGQWQQPNGWQQQGNWQPPQGTPQDYGQQAPQGYGQGYEQPSAHNFGGNGAPTGSHSIYPQAEQGMYAPPPAPPEQDSDPKRPQ